MSNRGRHRKRNKSKYSSSWISNVLDDYIIDKILINQEKYSAHTIRNLNVFEKDPYAGKYVDGFTWKQTPEGHDFWENVFSKVQNYKITNKL